MNNFITFIALFFTVHFCNSQNIESKIDAIISSSYTSNEPGISVLVAKEGKAIYKKAMGISNLELGTLMKTDNVFQIGSITKQFTAISILILEEQGKLRVKDVITKYIPNYPTKGNIITIQHLLNHTSGIKNSTPIGKQGAISKTDMSSTELISYFKNEPLDFIPGTRFKYSNAGYILLGRIIEITSGKSYADFIEQHIFNKIKMTSSSYGKNKEIIKNRASGYQKTQNIFLNADYMSMTLAYAAGGILSTVEDLLKWQNALNSNTIIKRSSLEKALKATKLNNGEVIPYGYGFRLVNLKGSPVIAHSGSTKGFTSIAMYLPKEKIFITALSNCNCKNVSEVSKKIALLFADKSVSNTKLSLKNSSVLKRELATVSIEILKQFTGTYEVKSNLNITIGLDDNDSLFLIAPNQTKKIKLFAKNDSQFYVKVSNTEITFNRDSENEVTSLIINQSGRKIVANKN